MNATPSCGGNLGRNTAQKPLQVLEASFTSDTNMDPAQPLPTQETGWSNRTPFVSKFEEIPSLVSSFEMETKKQEHQAYTGLQLPSRHDTIQPDDEPVPYHNHPVPTTPFQSEPWASWTQNEMDPWRPQLPPRTRSISRTTSTRTGSTRRIWATA
ncbi:hypothetical protein N7532_010277 [Penicillium argentinense]|uniref:Uncharacterized protein n=1 Tax=Penicillium argentinense TaxID=1131581 RepID=A0A9W9EPD2_9EURO|nr:uncharacterized protein N7532_010277 [Penicillium argentinense]KAJ5085506.1 hypothetical protein N7532_010277 [Penicillium argentinense]